MPSSLRSQASSANQEVARCSMRCSILRGGTCVPYASGWPATCASSVSGQLGCQVEAAVCSSRHPAPHPRAHDSFRGD